MKQGLRFLSCLMVLALTALAAQADEILLKNGRKLSGKFIRGDASVVEFRIEGEILRFKTSEVAQIIFEEPSLVKPPTGRRMGTPQVPVANPPQRPISDRTTRSQPAPATDQVHAQPQPSVTLPEGTQLTIRTVEPIDTDLHGVGHVFQSVLEDPLTIGSQTIVPRGSEVEGKIAYAEKSGMKGQSVLILELTEIRFDGKAYPIRTSDYSEVGKSQGKKTAGTIGGGAALGAIIGAIAGGGKGAAIGAATGAAVGTGVRVLTKGETLRVPAETMLSFNLQKPLTIEVK